MRVTFEDGVSIVHAEPPRHRSNTGHVGIHKRADDTYQVCLGKYILGWRKSLDDAIALRKEAEQHKANNTFDTWYAELKSKRRKYNNNQ